MLASNLARKGLQRGIQRTPFSFNARGFTRAIPKRTFYQQSQNETLFSKSPLKPSSVLLSLAAGAVFVGTFMQQANAEEKEPKVVVADEQEEEEVEEKKPAPRPNFPKYKYIIVGSGTAGFSALKELQEKDPEGEILVIGSEPYSPYLRPPLSKDLWNSEDPNVASNLRFTAFDGVEQTVWFQDEKELKSDSRVTFMTGKRVTDIDVLRKSMLLDDGSIIEYDKCLVATGGKPRQLARIPEEFQDKVTTFRTLDDFRNLEGISKEAKHIVVVGGSFLGSELACGISKRTKGEVKVTQVYPETGIMATVFPKYLSDYATNRVQSELGIEMRSERSVKGIEEQDGKMVVRLDNNETIPADHVVVAVGINPSVDFARNDFEIDEKNGGILVNSELQARSDVYVAGDVASYYDTTLGRRRVEHHDHAIASGRHAARNMTGRREPYIYLPMYWSDLGSMGYEAVGLTDSKLNTVSVWQKEDGETEKDQFKKGIIYYLKDRKVVGAIFFNLYGKTDEGRRVIKLGRQWEAPDNLKNLISLEEESHD